MDLNVLGDLVQGLRSPDGPAAALLEVVASDRETAIRELRA